MFINPVTFVTAKYNKRICVNFAKKFSTGKTRMIWLP